jgi:hypothetical protein
VSSRRAKATGRSERDGHFVKIPNEMLLEPAVITLGHAAFRVMVIIASQCWVTRDWKFGQNGTAAFTDSFARRYGLDSKDTIVRALRDLRDRGLIVQTRPGLKMRRIPSLWAVAWLPITHVDGQPIKPWRDAPHGYRNWRQNEGTERAIAAVNTAKIHPDGRGTVTPTIGVQQDGFTPIGPTMKPSFTPTSGGTLRISGGTPAPRTSVARSECFPARSRTRAAPVDVDELRRAVRLLAAEQPHLRPADLARACCVPAEHFAVVMAGLR